MSEIQEEIISVLNELERELEIAANNNNEKWRLLQEKATKARMLAQRLSVVETKKVMPNNKRIHLETLSVNEANLTFGEENQSEAFYKVKELAELFGVTVQGVHKWIKEEKIDFIPVYGPGSEKKVKEYLIPKKQFIENKTPMIKRLNETRKIQELKNKINWNNVKSEDVFPTRDDKMEELDLLK